MTKSIKDVGNFIKIAQNMLERGELDTCVNRLYIACENIAEILLEKASPYVPKRHDKAANAIEHLFKTGKLRKNFSETMKRLYELHMFSDYGKELAIQPTKEELQDILKEVKEFLACAEES